VPTSSESTFKYALVAHSFLSNGSSQELAHTEAQQWITFEVAGRQPRALLDEALSLGDVHACISIGTRMRTATETSSKFTKGEQYPAPIQQNCVWCRINENKYNRTTFRCKCSPTAFLCKDGSGQDNRQCFSLHKRYGLPVKPPAAKRAKRQVVDAICPDVVASVDIVDPPNTVD